MARPRKQTYSLDMYLKKVEKGNISNDADVQRNFVWTNEQINELLVSVLTDDYIPPMILGEESGSQLRIVDGGQRTSALNKFRYGNYKITSSIEDSVISYKKKVNSGNGDISWEDAFFDIKNKTYEQLPDELKDKFDEYQIETVIHEHCDMHRISKYIKRYNNQTPMNTNQKAFTYIDKYARKIREILNSRFFIDYSSFTEAEKTKGVVERVVVETVMCSYHMDNWKKQTKAICAYLNKYAVMNEFEKLEDNLQRLEQVITDDIKDMFNSKDSFILLTVFDRFTRLGQKDRCFADFLRAFKGGLRYEAVGGQLFDEADKERGTKDKAVVMSKLHILETLMHRFLNIGRGGTEVLDCAAFIKEMVGSDTDEEDVDLFEMIANDKSEVIEDIDSWLLSDENRPSLLALVGYAVRNDYDDVLEEWLPVYEKNSSFIFNQKDSFFHMKDSFDTLIAAKEKC